MIVVDALQKRVYYICHSPVRNLCNTRRCTYFATATCKLKEARVCIYDLVAKLVSFNVSSNVGIDLQVVCGCVFVFLKITTAFIV